MINIRECSISEGGQLERFYCNIYIYAVYTYITVYIVKHMGVYTHICVCVYTYKCGCVYMYIYIPTFT